jgi:Lrp/AsnC family transcriptional regulator for asnA, asnC and gidA
MRPQIDDLDARIIRELQVNGRLANTELARRLGVGEATVRKRIDRMLASKLIQVVAWADPLKVGYQHFAIIGIQVKVPEIERAAKKLA